MVTIMNIQKVQCEHQVTFLEDTIRTIHQNGMTSYHPKSGGVFCPATNNDTLTYTNMFAYDDEHTTLFREDLRAGVLTGLWAGSSFYSLVRSGIPGNYNYYPVPLLFTTDKEREESAELHGKEVPRANWLKAKRNLVRKLAGAPLGD